MSTANGDGDGADNVIPIERARARRTNADNVKQRLRDQLEGSAVITGLPALGLIVGMMFAVAMSEPVNGEKCRRKAKKRKKNRRQKRGYSSKSQS